MSSTILAQRSDADGPVLARRGIPNDNQLDITPMIDVTFLLLIFFLVASVPDVQAALNLPPAQFGIGVSRREALVICVAEAAGGRGIQVYLSESKAGAPLSGSDMEQEAAVRAAAQAAAAEGKRQILLKAERGVKHGEVARIVRAAYVDGFKVNLAVLELR